MLTVHLFWDQVLDGETSFQTFFHVDQEGDTINNLLYQFNLRSSETIQVGDIEGTTDSCGIDTTGTSLLKTKFQQNVIESLVLGDLGNLDVDTTSKTVANV